MTQPPPDASSGFGWALPQRRAIVVVLFGVLLFASFSYLRNPYYVPDPQPAEASRAAGLMDRIDPNTADWQTFAALPAIGEKRAKEIVAYREQGRARRPNAIVFRRAEDLSQVRGIGPAIVATLRPYLVFPPTDATTQSH